MTHIIRSLVCASTIMTSVLISGAAWAEDSLAQKTGKVAGELIGSTIGSTIGNLASSAVSNTYVQNLSMRENTMTQNGGQSGTQAMQLIRADEAIKGLQILDIEDTLTMNQINGNNQVQAAQYAKVPGGSAVIQNAHITRGVMEQSGGYNNTQALQMIEVGQ
jgi:hypothetical protein